MNRDRVRRTRPLRARTTYHSFSPDAVPEVVHLGGFPALYRARCVRCGTTALFSGAALRTTIARGPGRCPAPGEAGWP